MYAVYLRHCGQKSILVINLFRLKLNKVFAVRRGDNLGKQYFNADFPLEKF